MSTLDTSGLKHSSSFGYKQMLGGQTITVSVGSFSIAAAPTSQQFSTTVTVPEGVMYTPKIQFSFESIWYAGTFARSVNDLAALVIIRSAHIESSASGLTLLVTVFNNTTGPQTVPAFTVTALLDTSISSFTQ